MILADENIPFSIIEALRFKGIDVYAVYEENRGISDETIIEIAKRSKRIILTEDKDFGEWVFAHGVDAISVLFLRYTYTELAVISEILVNLIDKKGKNLYGKFVTITTEKIRFRNI